MKKNVKKAEELTDKLKDALHTYFGSELGTELGTDNEIAGGWHLLTDGKWTIEPASQDRIGFIVTWLRGGIFRSISVCRQANSFVIESNVWIDIAPSEIPGFRVRLWEHYERSWISDLSILSIGLKLMQYFKLASRFDVADFWRVAVMPLVPQPKSAGVTATVNHPKDLI